MNLKPVYLKTHSFSILLCLLSYGISQGQEIMKTGGTTNSTFLFGSTAYARKSQMLYAPADLVNEQSGTINRIYFKYGTTGLQTQNLTHLRIKMGLTDITTYGTNPDFLTDLQSVMHREEYSIPWGTANTWFSIDLDTTFQYDAEKTLIVQVSFAESTLQNWGTNGTSNNVRKKVIAPDTAATSGSLTSTTWQDFGFDLGTISGVWHQVFSQEPFLYPNPGNGLIRLNSNKFKIADIQKIKILEATGRIIYTANSLQENQLDISHLPNGLYYFEMQGPDDLLRQKYIKE